MFDIAWTELLVVAFLILIVVGPKDLPKIMRSVGGMVRKAHGFARQFSAGMNQLAREADLEGLQKKAAAIKNFKVSEAAKAALDPDDTLEAGFSPNSIMGDLNQKSEPAVSKDPATEPGEADKPNPDKSKETEA